MSFSIKNNLRKIPIPIQVVFLIYLIGMGIFSFYRVLLLLSNIDKTIENSFGVLVDTLLVGMRFDTTISCYVLAVPMVLFIINYYILNHNKAFFKSLLGLTFLLYAVAFLLAAIDIPFFNFFF